jgi:hypothetical protein
MVTHGQTQRSPKADVDRQQPIQVFKEQTHWLERGANVAQYAAKNYKYSWRYFVTETRSYFCMAHKNRPPC